MALAGKNAQVKIASDVIAEMSDASMTINGELLDRTTFDDDGWRRKLAGIKDASISISGFYNPSDTTGQVALRTAALAGSVISDFTFLSDKNSATSGFKCDALVGSFEVGAEVAGLVSVSISLESDGEVEVSS